MHENASRVVPGGANRNIVAFSPYPIFVSAAHGAYLEDVDGNEYLDLLGNYTTLVLGHSNKSVKEAVSRQLDLGTSWAAATPLEAEVAEILTKRLPSTEQVRFLCSGTEATATAIRLCRAHTGRSTIAKFEGGYHGLNDYSLVSMSITANEAAHSPSPVNTAPSGVPDAVRETVLVLPFNDTDRACSLIEQHASDLAAVIVEPVMGVAGIIAPEPGFLEGLRAVTSRHRIVLVFDEVMSFRVSFRGAQGLYGVTPDLTVYGKVIGGGFPLAAIGGPRHLMTHFDPASGPRVLLSGTYGGHPVSLAAGLATLLQWTSAAVDDLNVRSAELADRLEEIFRTLSRPLRLNLVGSLFNFHFADQPVTDYRSSLRGDKELMRWLHLALLNEGVLIGPRGIGCLSTPMTQSDLETAVGGVAKALVALGLL